MASQTKNAGTAKVLRKGVGGGVKTNKTGGASSAAAARKLLHKQAGKAVMSKNDEKDGETGESLDKVRDLLFGNQMRESDKRFSRMEERLAAENASLREDIRKRFDTLEQFFKSEVESLTGRIKAEQTERMAAIKALTKELADTAKEVDERITKLDEATKSEQQKLRTQLLEQSKMLRDELREASEQQTKARTAAINELRESKIDRTALAGMLTEMAMQLSGETKPAKR